MKKIFTLGLIVATTTISGANAGFWEKLGFGKKSEPATLEQACNTDELTAICPEMVIGSQTMMGCLSENISSLSSKCAKFVKKYITEHKDEVIDSAKEAAETAKEDAKTAKEEGKAIAKEAKEQAKAVKAESKAHIKEITEAAKQTGQDFKETGKAIKESFK